MEQIRNFDPATDSEAVAAIYGWYVENTTATFELIPPTAQMIKLRLTNPALPCLVMERDGTILGYCYAHPWKKYPAYDITLESTIYLRPDSRGKGHGRLLMESLINECRKRGYVSLIACITSENTESCSFHESLGFRQVSQFHNVGRKFDRLLDVSDYQLIL